MAAMRFVVLLALITITAYAAAPPACDRDNGGIKLPAGFCAVVVADNIGTARHLTVAANGDIFVALQRPRDGGAIVAMRDTNSDGKVDVTERFGAAGGTGIALRNGYLY